MRLTDEKIADVKEYLNRSIKVTASSLIPQLSKYGIDLIDTIEALQQENNGWQERYYELDAGHSRLFKDFCKLQQENEQLRAQVARMREALEKAREALDYWRELYGIGLEVLNWHMNGNTEPFDSFYDNSGTYEALAEIDKAIGGKEDV